MAAALTAAARRGGVTFGAETGRNRLALRHRGLIVAGVSAQAARFGSESLS